MAFHLLTTHLFFVLPMKSIHLQVNKTVKINDCAFQRKMSFNPDRDKQAQEIKKDNTSSFGFQ